MFNIKSFFSSSTLFNNKYVGEAELIVKKKNNWMNFKYILKQNQLLSNNLIAFIFNKLWETSVISTADKNSEIFIIFKVYLLNFNSYKTIGPMQRKSLLDKNLLIAIFQELWNIQSDEYKNSIVTEIDIGFYIADNTHINDTKNSAINNDKTTSIESKKNNSKFLSSRSYSTLRNININNNTTLWSGYNLPKTMNLSEWGDCKWINSNKVIIHKLNSDVTYDITIKNCKHYIDYKIFNETIISFIDKPLKKPLNSFERTIKNNIYIYLDNNIIFKSTVRKCKFITPILKKKNFLKNYLTLDIETYNHNDVLYVYCISIYDGISFKSFYLSDFSSSEELILECLTYLIKDEYNNNIIYVHNLSNFDSIFLLNSLVKMATITLKPIRRDGRLINLTFQKDNIKLHFRDSYLLLPLSLQKLCEGFNVETKAIFPILFPNKNNLEYIGLLPEYKYFNNSLTLLEYETFKKKYINTVWDLKKESILYCEQDVKSLYLVIQTFYNKIEELFNINIHNYPTLPSLALAIYRTHYLKNNKIPIISGDMFDFFQQGYTGGCVDMYKPYHKGLIYRYDVNSLYPFIMKTTPVPVGNPTYFEGDILLIKNKPYGIFEAKITTPEVINIPLLQYRFKINNTTHTISPTGSWTGIYHSNELYNAMKHGYKIEIIRGYEFESKIIFKDYVNILYNIKKKSLPNTPYYLISKMLLNSLYGKFGMSPYIEDHVIVDNDKFIDIIKNHNIEVLDITELDNNKFWLSIKKITDSKTDYTYEKLNISVPIALSITANARIFMSNFKNNKTLYSDTDSIDVTSKLPDKYVGTGLGKFKLEHIFNEAVFLAPKSYGAVAININDNSTYEFIKIKGFKNKIPFTSLKELLHKDKKLELLHEKWYKDFATSHINIKNELYTLMVTSNKRELIYNSNNLLVDTKPLKITQKKLL